MNRFGSITTNFEVFPRSVGWDTALRSRDVADISYKACLVVSSLAFRYHS